MAARPHTGRSLFPYPAVGGTLPSQRARLPAWQKSGREPGVCATLYTLLTACRGLGNTHTETDTHTHSCSTHNSFRDSGTTLKRLSPVSLSVEAGEGRMAHNNVWNRANGMDDLIHSLNSAPAITTSPSSPIKVPPTSCGFYVLALVCFLKSSHSVVFTKQHFYTELKGFR